MRSVGAVLVLLVLLVPLELTLGSPQGGPQGAPQGAPQGDVVAGERPIWDLVRESDSLRAFLEQRAVMAPGAVAVIVDTGSAAALRRARAAIGDLQRGGARGPFIFSTFHRTGRPIDYTTLNTF